MKIARKALLNQLRDCKPADRSLPDWIGYLATSYTTSPMSAAAVDYLAMVKPEYRDSNPKIDFFSSKGEYVASTNMYATVRDALAHKRAQFHDKGANVIDGLHAFPGQTFNGEIVRARICPHCTVAMRRRHRNWLSQVS